LKLHIGGRIPADGWNILNIQPGPNVDYVGNCTDLSAFADCSVQTIYASHVLEHVSHIEILPTLKEWHRVLVPAGQVMISVPDMEVISRLLTHPLTTLALKLDLMQTTYGGQRDAYDFHKTGFTPDILAAYLQAAGFKNLQRIPEFGLFDDFSGYRIAGNLISLNVTGQREPVPG